MRKGIGICCILLGIVCVLASAGFVVYNKIEAQNGAQFSQSLLQNVQAGMEETKRIQIEQAENRAEETISEGQDETVPPEMATIPAGEYDSIGILSIPALELELPVLTDWSYEKLKKAPCHYYGSCYESDFVIAAHNYTAHFGRLSELRQGDLVFFTDAAGQTHGYEVVLTETLPPTAIEEMVVSGFDLSLYTCTPGGSSRVTVRCRRVNVYKAELHT